MGLALVDIAPEAIPGDRDLGDKAADVGGGNQGIGLIRADFSAVVDRLDALYCQCKTMNLDDFS